jgi:hypothetical protein
VRAAADAAPAATAVNAGGVLPSVMRG